VMSNVEWLLKNEAARKAISDQAIDVRSELFYRKESGLVCAADLAGYGSAHRYASENMHAFGLRQDEISQFFRRSVATRLEEMLTTVGTTQVQTAGDGFLAAFPDRVSEDRTSKVAEIVSRWTTVTEEVERLNGYIRDQRFRIGSRLAIHSGDYDYGRIGASSSFVPAFDGTCIIEVARLEQALGVAMREMRVVEDPSEVGQGGTALAARGHYVLLSPEINREVLGSITGRHPHWRYLGSVDVSAKEYASRGEILVWEG
jgi:hypothetical protein